MALTGRICIPNPATFMFCKLNTMPTLSPGSSTAQIFLFFEDEPFLLRAPPSRSAEELFLLLLLVLEQN